MDSDNPIIVEQEKKSTAPTINDLRIKLCYICREEENAESAQGDSQTTQQHLRAWTHPCSCTLIAHQDCLLKWIQSSQTSSSRALNALKCPQCGTQYEIESKRPALLKVLAIGNKILQRSGTYFTMFGFATAVGIAGTTLYICLTAYGAYSMERFFGKEMFDLILTDDPVNWPWSAYINLPLLPISLILSRYQRSSTSLVIPLLISWFPSPPVGEPARKLYEYWSNPDNAQRLARFSIFSGSNTNRRNKLWPPPPVLFALVGLPFVKAMYKKTYAWAYWKLLKAHQPVRNDTRRNGLRFNEGPFIIQILANVNDGDGDDPEPGQAGLVDGHPNGAAGAGADEAEGDPDVAVVQAAEQLIQINATSFGRRVGGALLIPAISSMMGSLLLRLSTRSYLLRIFLGLKQEKGIQNGRSWLSSLLVGNHSGRPGSDKAVSEQAFSSFSTPNANAVYPEPPLSWRRLISPSSSGGNAEPWKNMSRLQQLKVGLQLVVNAVIGGSRMWTETDPVWWRNCVGFGVFVAIKDAIHLLHLWLKKRELESRRVKNKDFSGVDIRELDLLPSFFFR